MGKISCCDFGNSPGNSGPSGRCRELACLLGFGSDESVVLCGPQHETRGLVTDIEEGDMHHLDPGMGSQIGGLRVFPVKNNRGVRKLIAYTAGSG